MRQKRLGRRKMWSARRNVKAAWEDYRRVLERLQGRKQQARVSEKEEASSTPTPVGRRIASRIPPGHINWLVGWLVVLLLSGCHAALLSCSVIFFLACCVSVLPCHCVAVLFFSCCLAVLLLCIPVRGIESEKGGAILGSPSFHPATN